MKTKIAKICLFFFLLLGFFLIYNQIFRVKMDEGDSIKIFYEQKKDTVDVLALGSSHVFGSINPAILYRDFGIACYDLCGAGSPTKVSYYYLLEALKTQTPKVIILGIGDSTYLDGNIDAGIEMSYLWTGNMKLSKNKIDMVREISYGNWFEVLLGYPITHGRYDGDLAERDFLPYRGDKYHKYYKGNRVFWGTKEEEYNVSDFPYTSEVGELPYDTQKWIDGVINIGNDISADVILYAPPALRTREEQMTINAIGEYAKEKNIEFLDLNSKRDLLEIDFESEMNDKEHVNYLGQEKTSRFVGEYLTNNYTLPDRRGDSNYDSWRLCEEDYETAYSARVLSLQEGTLSKYLEYISDKDYTIFVKIKNVDNSHNLLVEQDCLQKIGISSEMISDNSEFLICNGKIQSFEFGKDRTFGSHSIVINENNLQYDFYDIGFPDNHLTFIVFDNKQESIIEYRYYLYDNTKDEWVLQREDCGMQNIWNKR